MKFKFKKVNFSLLFRSILFLTYFTQRANYCLAREEFSNEELLNIDENEYQLGKNRSNILWITEIFEKAKQEFRMDSVSPKCSQDVQLYANNLQNQTVWAVKMKESSQWPTGAIYRGELFYVGNYKECLSVAANVPQGRIIKGQYCLAEVHYGLPPNTRVYANNMTENPGEWSSAWQALLQYKSYGPSRRDRTKLTFAQCVPSSCTPAELERALNSTLWPAFRQNGLSFDISVPNVTCAVAQDKITPPQSYFIMTKIVSVWLAILMACTLYDFIRSKPTEGKNLHKTESVGQAAILYFSVARNMRLLFESNSSNDIGVLRVLKIYMMICVIYAHRYMYFFGYPMTDVDSYERRHQRMYNMFVLVHANVVDVFFMISGFLTFHHGLRMMKKAPALYIPLNILLRWIRTVPVFAFVAIIVIYMMPYWGDGPFWVQRISLEANNCARTLWANLLAVNNMVDTEHQCLVVSWYISVDLQLCILGTLLLFFFSLNEKFGLVLTLVTLFGSWMTTFAVAYINEYHGLLRFYMRLLNNPRLDPEFSNFYIRTYTRIGPYLVGFLAGYAAKKLKDSEYTMNKKQVWIGSISVFVFGELSQYYGIVFYDFDRPYKRVESALYASFSRTLFATWGAWSTVVGVNKKFGWFGKFTRLKVFVPVDKLTYCAFIVNTVIQMYHAASQVAPFSYPSDINLCWMVIADIFLSYSVGLLLHISLEAPLSHLCKLLQVSLVKLLATKSQISMKDVEAQVKREDTSSVTIQNVNDVDGSVKCDTLKSKCRDKKAEFINEAYQNENGNSNTRL